MAEAQYDAIVIGAGHNGLVTAGYLARDGLKVLVLERLDKIGGAVTTDEFSPGFLGPMCSYWCSSLRGKVIDDLRLRDHGFEIVHSRGHLGQAFTFHPFPDGSFLGGPHIKSELDAATQLRTFSESDARAYFEWNRFWERAAGIFNPYFLTEPPSLSDLAEDVRGTSSEEVLEVILTWSYTDLLDHYFEDERVKAHFMYNTEADPRSSGSILGPAVHRCNLFTRPEDRGIPRMSMGNITEALAASVRSDGVEIRTRAQVDKVIVIEGEAKGVRLANGAEVLAGLVVSNADPKRTFSTLFKPEEVGEQVLKKIGRWKTGAGCVKFLAALDRIPDFTRYLDAGYDPAGVVGVSLRPSVEYQVQSWTDAMAGKPTSSPIHSLQFTSLAEPGLVRGTGHVLSDWVLYQPPSPVDRPWEEIRNDVGEQIIESIAEYAPDFRERLLDWTVQSPIDIQTRVGMTDGNIRHLDMIPNQLLSQRQPYRTNIRNFYMCGSGTHPMGEVTGAPGHNAAHAILRDLEHTSTPQ